MAVELVVVEQVVEVREVDEVDKLFNRVDLRKILVDKMANIIVFGKSDVSHVLVDCGLEGVAASGFLNVANDGVAVLLLFNVEVFEQDTRVGAESDARLDHARLASIDAGIRLAHPLVVAGEFRVDDSREALEEGGHVGRVHL